MIKPELIIGDNSSSMPRIKQELVVEILIEKKYKNMLAIAYKFLKSRDLDPSLLVFKSFFSYDFYHGL